MTNNILITGCAGFIGSNLIRFLLFNDKDIKIYGLDKLKNYEDIHNVYSNKSLDFFMANVCDLDILKRIVKFNNPEYIVHLANINDNNIAMIDNNIKGLCNILDVCKEFNCKLIFISSADVYNGLEKKTENDYTFGKNSNAAYKIFCENLIQLSGVKYNIVRAPEVFGPRQTNGIVVNMFLDIKGHDKICLYNKGSIVRDLLHVEDLSNGILILLQNWIDNQIYNISANIDFTELEIASFVTEALKEGKIEFIPEDTHTYKIELDCAKIKSIKWKPIKKFKTRVQETIAWYNQNKWFFK